MIEDLRWLNTPEGWILEAYDGHRWFKVKCANAETHAPVFDAVVYFVSAPAAKEISDG